MGLDRIIREHSHCLDWQVLQGFAVSAIEVAAWALVYWQEFGYRVPLRASGVELSKIQQLYVTNGGDFIDGYAIAYFGNYGLSLLSCLGWALKPEENILHKIGLRALRSEKIPWITAALASGAVIIAEKTGFMNKPDDWDIPLGILGAAAYLALHTLLNKTGDAAARKAYGSDYVAMKL